MEAEKIQSVASLVLEKLQRFLEGEERVDPQKCKHITSTLKDIRELQGGDQLPGQLMVVFDKLAEEAAS